MTVMEKGEPVSQWRNFAAWSAVGAAIYVLAIGIATALLHQNPLRVIFATRKVAAELGLCLILSMVVTAVANGKRAFTLRRLRNFLIKDAAAVVAFLLVIWGFSALPHGGMSASAWVAAAIGSTLVVVALLGMLVMVSAHAHAGIIDDEETAEDMRERGRVFFFSFLWVATYGLLLILLGLASPQGLLSPAIALAGALVLIAILAALTIAGWRLSDELGRTLTHESGNIAFYLILVFGGGWAVLAHLRFVPPPAPLDWLILFTVLMFAASIVAAGRRSLLRR